MYPARGVVVRPCASRHGISAAAAAAATQATGDTRSNLDANRSQVTLGVMLPYCREDASLRFTRRQAERSARHRQTPAQRHLGQVYLRDQCAQRLVVDTVCLAFGIQRLSLDAQ